MLRRLFTFLLFVALVAAAGLLVYLNPDESSLRLSRVYDLELPLGVLIVGSALAGGLLVFLASMLHEGRRALREWRARRRIASADRTAQLRTDGMALTVAGEHRRARALLAKAIKGEEAAACDVIAYAGTFSAEGDHGSARQTLEKGLTDFGNDASLLVALGSACRAAGDLLAAGTALERALSLHPASPTILVALRDVLFDHGSWQRAAEVQERVLAVRPGDQRERNRLDGARFEASLGSPIEERLPLLDRILQDSPDFVPALLAKVDLLESAEHSEEAIRMLERALKRRPNCELLETMARLSDRAPKRFERVGRRMSAQTMGKPALAATLERALATAGNLQPGTGNGTRPVIELPRCSGCGRIAEDWVPRCPGCGLWDSLERT